jgi:hypothetical protein
LAQVAAPARARITRIGIAIVQSPTFEGASFGTADIGDLGVERIGGIDFAKKPVGATKSNRRLLFEINNRGNIL